MITPPRNALVSYHYYKNFDLDRLANLNLIGDSGAFSARTTGAEISTADLAAWAKRWSHRLSWVASLDVMGDIGATRRNWLDMTQTFGVPAVPTVHFGELSATRAALDFYVQQGVSFVGLGGLVGVSRTPRMRWVIAMFKHARTHYPQVQFHGWGQTDKAALQLPWRSVDSSSWTQGVRYAQVELRDPDTGKSYKIRLDGRSTYSPEIARVLTKHYGVTPAQVARTGGHNWRLIIALSALSAAVLEQQFQRRHQGSRLHLASGHDTGKLYGLEAVNAPHLAGDQGSSYIKLANALHLSTSDKAGGLSVVNALHLVDDCGAHLEAVSQLHEENA